MPVNVGELTVAEPVILTADNSCPVAVRRPDRLVALAATFVVSVSIREPNETPVCVRLPDIAEAYEKS